MLYRSDLGHARIEELIAHARYQAGSRHPGHRRFRVRILVARRLVLIGARLHGTEPAVIGRVVILDECGKPPKGLRHAA